MHDRRGDPLCAPLQQIGTLTEGVPLVPDILQILYGLFNCPTPVTRVAKLPNVGQLSVLGYEATDGDNKSPGTSTGEPATQDPAPDHACPSANATSSAQPNTQPSARAVPFKAVLAPLNIVDRLVPRDLPLPGLPIIPPAVPTGAISKVLPSPGVPSESQVSGVLGSLPANATLDLPATAALPALPTPALPSLPSPPVDMIPQLVPGMHDRGYENDDECE